MSTSTMEPPQVTDPFERAIEAKRAKDAAEEVRRAEEAEKNRQNAAAALKQRQERELQAKLAAYKESISDFRHYFFSDVATYAIDHDWSIGGIEAAKSYAAGLVTEARQGVELANVSSSMKKVIHDIFVRKIVFYGDKLPKDPFYGQACDWYPALLEKIRKPKKQRSYKAHAPKAHIPTPGEVAPKDKQVVSDPAEELKVAITPPKKHTSRKTGAPKRGKKAVTKPSPQFSDA